MAMLEFENVEVFYGKVQALRGIGLRVEAGEIVALLGNNGAGKTTTLSTASALVKAHSGTVTFDGADITRAHPWNVVGAGLIHVPEGRRIFSTLTVLENLQLGGYLVKQRGVVAKRIEQVFGLLPLLPMAPPVVAVFWTKTLLIAVAPRPLALNRPPPEPPAAFPVKVLPMRT